MQSQWLTHETASSEQQIHQLAALRYQQIDAGLMRVRQVAGGFFVQIGQHLRARVMALQASVVHMVQNTIAAIAERIQRSIASAQGFVTRGMQAIQARIGDISASIQGHVSGVTGRVQGFINTIPLPDLPGVGRVRGLANRILGGGSHLINGALSLTTRTLQGALGYGAQLLNLALSGLSQMTGLLMQIMSSTLTGLLQMFFQAFNAALAALGNLLLHLLQRILSPLLSTAGRLARRWVDYLRQRALRALRLNHALALEAIADAVEPGAGGDDSGPPASEAERISALQQLRARAQLQMHMIVRLFSLLTGEAFLLVIRLTLATIEYIRNGLTRFFESLLAQLGQIASQAISFLQNLVHTVVQMLGELLSDFQALIGDVVSGIGRMLLSPVSTLTHFANRAADRLTGAVSSLVSRFVPAITGASVDDADTLVGSYTPAQLGPMPLRGPIVKPSPGTIEVIFKTAAQIVVAAIQALVRVAGPKAAAIIIILIVILLVILLIYLLYLLFKWLYDTIVKPKPRPTKRVIKINPKRLEFGVGGFDMGTTATIAPGTPRNPPLRWRINPGGTPPAGVTVVGSGRRVALHSVHPPHGTILGGSTFTVQAELASNPADFAISQPITLVQILDANYSANPPLANVPSLQPGTFPPNTGEPNRDGISGNTVDVNAFPRPTGRRMRLEFRRSLGASASALTVKPGSQTGDIGLRIRETVTGATLDETLPSTAGGATLMADLTINAVPTRVTGLAGAGPTPQGPYGVQNAITFGTSDSLHPPLTRVVGELITNGGDDFNVPPPNGGFNNTFRLNLAVPANRWTDQLWSPFNMANTVDGRFAIDVNRFVGPGVPQLPRRFIYRQRFQYSSWQGAGTTISRTIADGKHIRSLVNNGGNFQFQTGHVFGSVAAPVFPENYLGPPLITLSNLTVTPNAAGATALAADGASTASVTANSNIAGQTVNWRIRSGDLRFTTANPVTLPAAATLQAGTRSGNFKIRAEDTVYANRQIDGVVPVARVALRGMRAVPGSVPAGTASTLVTLSAEPGGRVVDWTLDPAATAAGVTVNPGTTGPGPAAMAVNVTRPAGFTGRVKIIATDRVTGRSNSIRVRFN